MPANNEPTRIVVLGCGVIGLTTAVRLLESFVASTTSGKSYRPIEVHIVADHFPDDPLDARYASTAAGAHHLSFADDGDHRQRRWDSRTFKVMNDEWQKEGEQTGLMRIKQTEYMSEGTHLKIYEEHPDFTILPKSTLPKGIAHSVSFTSFTMTPSIYLARLLARFRALTSSLGHPSPSHFIHRLHLPSLSALSSPSFTGLIGGPADLLINCTGIGASSLGGVADSTVFPMRGQVVKLHAPWVKEGYTRQVGSLDGGEGGQRTYVIPRVNGEVIVGGTREEGDWEGKAREGTKDDILKRALEICPDLLPVQARGKGKKGEEWKKLREIVMGDVVGFRPARTAGVRLERGAAAAGEGARTQVVHNYGHGGAGWQSCWGCAEDVVLLVQDWLQEGQKFCARL